MRHEWHEGTSELAFRGLRHKFSAYRGLLSSRIVAGQFQNEKDIDAYLGMEYDVNRIAQKMC